MIDDGMTRYPMQPDAVLRRHTPETPSAPHQAGAAISRAHHPPPVRFFVVLATGTPVEAVVLCSVTDADQARIAFHQEWERLIQNRVVGELVLVQHADEVRVLLREALG